MNSLAICSLFYICSVIQTFFGCFEWLFLCFTQFGDSSYCLSSLKVKNLHTSCSFPHIPKSKGALVLKVN